MRRLVFLLMCCGVVAVGRATGYSTRAFDERVHTLQVRVGADMLAPPVTLLGGNDRIVILFDLFADEPEELRYRVAYCNADWSPSPLAQVEYLDGFAEGSIDDYALSFNTYRNYVNYRLVFPNENVSFRLSGNYVVSVYPESRPDDVLLTACFSLAENLVELACEITTRTDVDYNKGHQQLSVKLAHPRYEIRDPRSELQMYVSQNVDYSDRHLLAQPLYVQPQELEYAHAPALVFPAGNEYRRFEIVSPHYNPLGVESMRYFEPYYHALLTTDRPRAAEAYVYDETQNGRFFIRAGGSEEPDTEADYYMVHFTLETGRPLDGEVYLDGEFTLGRRDASTRMTYNAETHSYEKTLPLKQGAYNYRYVLSKNGRADAAPIEGNHYETLNEYQISVYHRPTGGRYDRLIGYTRCRM